MVKHSNFWDVTWRRVHSTPLILYYHPRSYQWTLPRKKGKAKTASEHFPKWIWVSGKLPARNFVLAGANKVTTAARRHVDELPSLRNFRLAFATNVDNPGITPIHARTLGWTSPVHKGKVPKQVRVIWTRSQICKESKISVISRVVFLVENIYLFDLPSIVGCEPFPVDYWWYYLCPWCPKLSLLAISLSQSCLTLQSWTSSSWPCSWLYEHIKHE
jgi:hypothetical protein